MVAWYQYSNLYHRFILITYLKFEESIRTLSLYEFYWISLETKVIFTLFIKKMLFKVTYKFKIKY